jgi:hypothetical protein
MKLYTEEEILSFLKREFSDEINAETFIENLTPIELPNDSLCVNCDESKSIHNVCMDCIIKIGKENIQLPSDKQQHEQTWIAALDYGIGKMKGLNDLESKDAFENYYNETYGGNK